MRTIETNELCQETHIMHLTTDGTNQFSREHDQVDIVCVYCCRYHPMQKCYKVLLQFSYIINVNVLIF